MQTEAATIPHGTALDPAVEPLRCAPFLCTRAPSFIVDESGGRRIPAAHRNGTALAFHTGMRIDPHLARRDLYTLLRVKPWSTTEEIRRAHRPPALPSFLFSRILQTCLKRRRSGRPF